MYFGGLDAECYRLREEGFSVRQIGRKMGIAGSSVQRCLARVDARRARAVEDLDDDAAPVESDLADADPAPHEHMRTGTDGPISQLSS